MNKLITFQLFMFSLLFIIIFSVGYTYQKTTVEQVYITVIDKQRITDNSGSKYLIFGDKESFENTDSMFHVKHNSSDIQSHFHIGCSYEVEVYGKRVPFLSMYRNITKIIKEDPCSTIQ